MMYVDRQRGLPVARRWWPRSTRACVVRHLRGHLGRPSGANFPMTAAIVADDDGNPTTRSTTVPSTCSRRSAAASPAGAALVMTGTLYWTGPSTGRWGSSSAPRWCAGRADGHVQGQAPTVAQMQRAVSGAEAAKEGKRPKAAMAEAAHDPMIVVDDPGRDGYASTTHGQGNRSAVRQHPQGYRMTSPSPYPNQLRLPLAPYRLVWARRRGGGGGEGRPESYTQERYTHADGHVHDHPRVPGGRVEPHHVRPRRDRAHRQREQPVAPDPGERRQAPSGR